MSTFNHSFTVTAPLATVSDFHRDTRTLEKLTPPPLFVQVHTVDPLAEGAEAEFTMWFGPIPIRWQAVHSHVSQRGFTDTQVRGPLKKWVHRHEFTPIGEKATRISDQITYEHHRGLRGLFSRLLFNRVSLQLLFTARHFITRWHLKQNSAPANNSMQEAQ